MWLDGTPIDLGATYAVTVNSFLATGGDNFTALAGGTNKQDTGMTDLQAMVDYMAEFANTGAGDPPLPVDYAPARGRGPVPGRRAGVVRRRCDHVKFDLTSLAMTSPADVDETDTAVQVSLNGTSLGSFPVNNAIGTDILDEYGTASVDVIIPAGTPGGRGHAARDGQRRPARSSGCRSRSPAGRPDARPDAGHHDGHRERPRRSPTARPGHSPSR